MKSRLLAGMAGLLIVSTVAAADGPAGAWKLSLPRTNLTFLLRLEEKDGKWTSQVLGSTLPQLSKATVADIAVAPDSLRFAVRMPPGIPLRELTFDGKLPPDPKTGRIAGSLQAGGEDIVLTHLEPSKLTSFDKYALDKEAIDQSTDPDVLLQAAIDLIKAAGEKKAKIEEVRGWADKAFRPAENYGLRWQLHAATRLAEALVGQKEMAAVAVEYGRKADRLLDPSMDPNLQMAVLESVSRIHTQAGRADDAKQIDARLNKLEERDYADYVKRRPFKAENFEGRKSKSDRAVLVELFTGAECAPCVAADVAFDALQATYKTSDVVLLQYHVHIPGPDPLSNNDTMARLQYYGRKVEGTPTMLFNGKPAAPGGGPLQAARKKYAEFREVIEPLLEKDAAAKLQLAAARTGGDVSIKVNVVDAARTGDKIRLRLALVEEHVRYQGGNQLKYHHFVVRALPGGALGTAVDKKQFEHSATVNLDELRTKLNDYLTGFTKENEVEFPRPDRPMRFKNLRVVAFVQDDETGDVLQAVQADVK